MNTAYQFWLASLTRQLVHADALECAGAGEVAASEVIASWHAHGFTARRIAKTLNNRYRDGYLARKRARRKAVGL